MFKARRRFSIFKIHPNREVNLFRILEVRDWPEIQNRGNVKITEGTIVSSQKNSASIGKSEVQLRDQIDIKFYLCCKTCVIGILAIYRDVTHRRVANLKANGERPNEAGIDI